MKEFGIGGRELKSGEFGEGRPGKRGATDCLRFAGVPMADAKAEVDGAIWVGMDHLEEPTDEPHLNGKLFV